MLESGVNCLLDYLGRQLLELGPIGARFRGGWLCHRLLAPAVFFLVLEYSRRRVLEALPLALIFRSLFTGRGDLMSSRPLLSPRRLLLGFLPGLGPGCRVAFWVDLSLLDEGFDPVSDNRTHIRRMQQHGMVFAIHGVVCFPLRVCWWRPVRLYIALLQESFEDLPGLCGRKGVRGDSPPGIP